jgi:ubiquinone biosynthesis accessory factor UbiK
MQSPQQLFQAIQEQVSQIFPDATKVAQDEISAHMKALISSVIGKLDLVSREEFDAQQAVLERTRAKLEQLEKEFADLEQRFGSNSG